MINCNLWPGLLWVTGLEGFPGWRCSAWNAFKEPERFWGWVFVGRALETPAPLSARSRSSDFHPLFECVDPARCRTEINASALASPLSTRLWWHEKLLSVEPRTVWSLNRCPYGLGLCHFWIGFWIPSWVLNLGFDLLPWRWSFVAGRRGCVGWPLQKAC